MEQIWGQRSKVRSRLELEDLEIWSRFNSGDHKYKKCKLAAELAENSARWDKVLCIQLGEEPHSGNV